MEGSSGRRVSLRRRFVRGMGLLLSADPGPAAMLDAVRRFDPAAKRILPYRIQVDGRSQFYLSRAYPIDATMRAQVGLPPDVGVAYFLKWVADSEADAARYREQGARLLDHLAAHFGGVSWPLPATSIELGGDNGRGEEPKAGRGMEELGAGRGSGGRRLAGGRALVRIGLLFVCALVFLGFAADDGTAGAWPSLVVNALTGMFFAAATVLLAGRHLGRR
ncbi:MAG: hypothetical protein ACRDNF_03510 [Streptosporangiaceae bacterium]